MSLLEPPALFDAPAAVHRTYAELEAELDHFRGAPQDDGVLELVVARPGPGKRVVLPEARLDVELGLVGDCWSTRPCRLTPDRSPHPGMQLNLMSSRVVAAVAVDPARRALAGDQLYVDLDLSPENLPTGTRLSIGSAVVEVTAEPHTGCKKFVAHFGADAMRFVNGRLGRPLRLRGINARVVQPGTVRPGDRVRKLP